MFGSRAGTGTGIVMLHKENRGLEQAIDLFEFQIVIYGVHVAGEPLLSTFMGQYVLVFAFFAFDY